MNTELSGVIIQHLQSHREHFNVAGGMSPALRYRLEGYLQAMLQVHDIQPAWLVEQWARVFGDQPPLHVSAGKVGITLLMQRAPVVPTTKD